MKKFKITYCHSKTFSKEQESDLYYGNTEKQAMDSLFIQFWGTPIFIVEVKEVHTP